MAAKIIPNSFQSPNDYVDVAMELLTGEEYKCLSFAARHILGWQDKINSREGVISLSMFEHGYTDGGGEHYGGTGITRAAVQTALRSLVTFKLLIELGEPTPEGQRWQLGSAPDWDGLMQRDAEKKVAARDRTAKATAARLAKREAGTSDVPVRATNQSQYVARTEGGSSDVLNQNQSNPFQKQEIARARIFELYEQAFGLITPSDVDDLKDAQQEFSAEWIEDAFKLTKNKGGRSWKYTRKILDGWQKQGRGAPPNKPAPEPPPPVDTTLHNKIAAALAAKKGTTDGA
ncbi:MAG: DnaD domain protein [Chloroflexi bacterium]|uniref:DnaD domain-containing protein n=1 Tax=Candidatus Flexifilum breve TaxID=3140694 RepID=UPI003135DC52|nr:DnaD domain protein [Chloroflexota bacterium]